MNCDQIRHALDHAFDTGEPLEADVRRHVDDCPACIAYRKMLDVLDVALVTAPDVARDPELVSRIQASIAADAPARVAAWPLWVIGVAGLLLMGYLASLIDTAALTASAEQISQASADAWDAGWAEFANECMAIPGALLDGLREVVGAGGMLTAASDYGRWIWPAFLACLAGVMLVNISEYRSRNPRRPGH